MDKLCWKSEKFFCFFLEATTEIAFYALTVHQELAKDLARLESEGTSTKKYREINNEAIREYEKMIVDLKNQHQRAEALSDG